MAESSVPLGMPETDIEPIKETLFAQQQLLQKLYTELDEERESSATAASEALSMILRLQGEKAALKMEASQYKRFAEEKICHAEESLAVFEDLMHQKEMETASLEFQIHAYRYKLLSLGCDDLGDFETRFLDNLLVQKKDQMDVYGNVRRINSLPSMLLKDSFQKKVITEKERSGIPQSDMIPRIVEENVSQEVNVHSLDLEKKPGTAGGDLNSYWERIIELDERVQEISHFKGSGRGTSSDLKGSCRFQANHSENLWKREADVNSAYFSSVHDVFEVPESDENREVCEFEKKDSILLLEGEKRLRKPDLVLEETAESHVQDNADWVKKMLLCANNETKLSKPGDGMKDGCHMILVQPSPVVDEYQAKIQQLDHRIEKLERERNSARQEISDEGEEGVKLLEEIREQLHSIQLEMRTRSKKSPPVDESSLHSVMEAMLHFWL